jgi:signal peptidase I
MLSPIKPFTIRQSSMDPIIQKGDRVLASSLWVSGKLKRGNMVFFKVAHFSHKLIKMVIGLPNEKFAIIDGKVHINNKPLENYIHNIPATANFDPVFISPNSYFLMGVNWNISEDSCHFGEVNIDQITHLAVVIYRPFIHFKRLI